MQGRDRILACVGTAGIPVAGGRKAGSGAPGKGGRAVFAFYGPRPPLRSFTKEIEVSKSQKTLAWRPLSKFSEMSGGSSTMRTLKRLACTFSLVLWICAAWPFQAGVIVNNFGPRDACNESTGWTVGFSPQHVYPGGRLYPGCECHFGED